MTVVASETMVPAPDPGSNLLDVRDLRVAFGSGSKARLVIDTATLSVPAGGSMGIVGESGSGKTMLCRALVGTLTRRGAAVVSGTIEFEGVDLTHAPEAVWRTVRGRRIGYVPQSSLAGLNPVLSIQTHLAQAIQVEHPDLGSRALRRRAVELLELVRITQPERVLALQPHQLSGGMRQRVVIACALALEPRLLLADEPTTALDVTIQREILLLLTQLRSDLGMALVLVTHDLTVIEAICDHVTVMYAGATVERAPLDALLGSPAHPYTMALLAARIDRSEPGQRLRAIGGEPPTIDRWPSGCRFWPRCGFAVDDCRRGLQPTLERIEAAHSSACLRWPHLRHGTP
jgi:oligopeptide/dipeptide ABC transporter ATP-binding protein